MYMNRLELSQPRRSVDTIASLAILLASAICVLALIGWVFGVQELKSIRPQWTEMRVITLICLGMCTAALALIRRPSLDRRRRRVAMALGAAVGLVGLLTVCSYVVDLRAGHETSRGGAPLLDVFLVPSYRMALWTAGIFLVTGCVLILLATGARRAAQVAHALAIPAALAGYLIPVSYLLGVESIHRLLNVSVALHTGIALCAISAAIFSVRPDTWLMRVLTEEHAGGAMARRLFPALLLVPVVIGWLRLYGERQAIFGSADGVVLVVMTYTFCLLSFLWWSARSVNRTDRQRLAGEIALRESEQRFATTLASIGDGVIATDLEGRVTFMNPVAEAVTGWTLSEAVRNPVAEVFRIINAETRLPEESPAERALRLREVVGLSNHAALVRRDGTEVPIDDSGAPIRDSDGQMTGVVIVFRDITARMQAENALRESEAHFRALTEALPQIVWTSDAEGGIEWFNQHWYAYTGRAPEDGRDQNRQEVIHPEDLPGTLTSWDRARQRGVVYENEQRLRRGDGEYRWFLSRAWPLCDLAGNVVRWVGTDTDIQEIKQAEAVLHRSRTELEAVVQERTATLANVNRELNRTLDELRASQAAVAVEQRRFRDVLEMLPISVALVNMDHRMPFTNRFFRERFGEIGVRRCFEFLFGRAEPCPACKTSLVRDTMSPRSSDWTGPDGRSYELANFPFVADDDSTLVMEVGVDVTERCRVEAELRAVNVKLDQRATQLRALTTELAQAEDRERRRLAQILHDHLQQLLVATRFSAESLCRTAKEESQRSSAAQMLELLDQAIGASRSLTVQLSPPILHEAGLAAGLMWLARWMESKHDFKVEVATPEPEEELSDDLRLLFFQAVRELLFNAVKHSGARSARVELDTGSPGEIRATVSDQGCGFDAAAQEASAAPGGFGLFNIRERFAYFDGRVSIDSSPGRGTRVALTAPVRRVVKREPTPRAILKPRSATSEIVRGQGRIRILVADDHAVVRQGLVRMLGREPGLEVVGEAVDGFDAVEKTKALRPEVVLMDLAMPRLNGAEATKLIKAEMPQVRVIGLSMHLGEDVARQMTEAGAVRYLSKDAPIEEITAAIRETFRDNAAEPG
jgi:PAS domain S-box-containing protein